MILFINACVRCNSRTERLARHLLSLLDEPAEEIRLSDLTFPKVDEAFLLRRNALIAAEEWNAPDFQAANQFAAADTVIIAAPYYDLSFPAALKQYLEQITVTGITFTYTADGFPKGLCRANKLYYLTTSGGSRLPEEYGAGYVKALAQNFYGIPEFRYYRAEGLDLDGADPEKILQNTMSEISAAEQASQ